MTPTQIELHNAHKARLQRIAQAAARINPKTDKEFSAALNAVEEPVTEPVDWADKQIDKNKGLWFSVVESIKLTPDGKPTVRAIQLATCEYYGIKLNDLVSARRTANVTLPRQVAMYLAKDMTESSYPSIARMTGNRDHTTAIHSFRKIEKLIKTDSDLASEVATIRRRFNETADCSDDA